MFVLLGGRTAVVLSFVVVTIEMCSNFNFRRLIPFCHRPSFILPPFPVIERHSLQLFVVVFNICLVWELLLLPSDAQAAPNLSSLRVPDGM